MSVSGFHRLAAEIADPQRRGHIRSARPKRHHRRHLVPATRQRGSGLIRRPPEGARHRVGAPPVQRHQPPAHQRVHPGRSTLGNPRVGGRDVGGVPPGREPLVQCGAVGVDHVRPFDVGARQRPDDLRGKQLLAVRVGDRQQLQIDPRSGVAASDAALSAVGACHRPAQPQRRAEHVAHTFGHFRTRTGDQLGNQFGGQLITVGPPRRSADPERPSCRSGPRSTTCCVCRWPEIAASPRTPRWAGGRCATRPVS